MVCARGLPAAAIFLAAVQGALGDLKMCIVGYSGWDAVSSVRVDVVGSASQTHTQAVKKQLGALHFSVKPGDVVTVSAAAPGGESSAEVAVLDEPGGAPTAGSVWLPAGQRLLFFIAEVYHIEAWTEFADSVSPLVVQQRDADEIVEEMPTLWRRVVEAHAGWSVTVLGDGFSPELSGEYGHLALSYKSGAGKKATKRLAERGSVFGTWTVPEAAGTLRLEYVTRIERAECAVHVEGPTFTRALLGRDAAEVFIAVHASPDANEVFWQTVHQALAREGMRAKYWADGRWNSQNLLALWAALNRRYVAEQEPMPRDPVLHALNVLADSGAELPSPAGLPESMPGGDVSDRSLQADLIGALVAMCVAIGAVGFCCGRSGMADGAGSSSRDTIGSDHDVAPTVHGDAWPVESVGGIELEREVLGGAKDSLPGPSAEAGAAVAHGSV